MDRKKGNQFAEAEYLQHWQEAALYIKLFKCAVYRDVATFGQAARYVAVQKSGVMKWGSRPVEEGHMEPDFTGQEFFFTVKRSETDTLV